MRNKLKIIESLLVWKHGTWASPRSDGRIEIPQHIVSKMNWNTKKIFIGIGFGEFIISADENIKHADNIIHSGTIITNGNRIIIPSSIIKKSNFSNKSLCFVVTDDYIIARANIINVSSVQEFIDSLSSEQQARLIKIVFQDIEEKRVHVSFDPELIILGNNSLVFVPIKPAYCFPAKHIGNEIVYCDDSDWESNPMYLVPGVKRTDGNLSVGFLLLDSILHSKLCGKIKENNNSIMTEVIFMYDIFSFGCYKIYTNPPVKIDNKVLSRAIEACNDPEEFLKCKFTRLDLDWKISSYKESIEKDNRLYNESKR